MAEEPTKKSILAKAISSFNTHHGFFISIHDTSGILHYNPDIELPVEMQVHDAPFCQFIKSFPHCYQLCLHCKAASLRKASRVKAEYYGQCHAGVTEIVKPVFVEGKLACVIFIGNLALKEKQGEMLTKFRRISRKTGCSIDSFNAQTKTLAAVSENSIPWYNDILDVLEYLVKSLSPQKPLLKKQPSNAPIFSTANHWAVQAIQNYVEEYYNKDLHLSQLARLYFLNPDYLCRLFRKETGMNFTDYVNMIRIQYGKHLLKRTSEDITSISLQLGFNSTSYFNRIFKKITGQTPGEYRHTVSTNLS